MVVLTQSQSIIQVRCDSQCGEANIDRALEAGLHAALEAGYLGSTGGWARPAAFAIEAVVCHILLCTYGAASAFALCQEPLQVCLSWRGTYGSSQAWQQKFPEHTGIFVKVT